MIKIAVLCLCLFIGAVMARDRKNCFCQAVEATSSKVIHDWGSIRTHSHWISVSCRRLRGCKNDCNTHVKTWVKSNPSKCDGMKIRSQYKASVCGKGLHPEIIECKCVTFDCKAKSCHEKCIKQGQAKYFTCLTKCLAH
ncbi:hypothetical protein KUTeg_021406 [Tegillarca granosa]|uniref:Uncharacterized protein n=1 Tax=Tegillarca granosa TaxID=220873 RepID=A0ABQ9E3N5_TEGGR|nr:hypothetical protein KUTeg_021406 [Tegillarca granosa]